MLTLESRCLPVALGGILFSRTLPNSERINKELHYAPVIVLCASIYSVISNSTKCLTRFKFVRLLKSLFPSNLEVRFTSALSWPAHNTSTDVSLQRINNRVVFYNGWSYNTIIQRENNNSLFTKRKFIFTVHFFIQLTQVSQRKHDKFIL